MCVSPDDIHRMAAEAVEWQKLGLRNLPLSAGSFSIQNMCIREYYFEYFATLKKLDCRFEHMKFFCTSFCSKYLFNFCVILLHFWLMLS